MKRIFGIKFKIIVIFLISLLIMISVSVTINNKVMNNWNPSESLVGNWRGQDEVSAPFKKGQSPSEYTEDWIKIEIMIESDGNVTGIIGEAELIDCKVKQNRTWFERFVRIKTDFVIKGYLENGINHDDTIAKREISIPFNLLDRKLKGSIFEIEGWKYPDPLFPRLLLYSEEK